MKLLDGTVLKNVMITANFPLDCEDSEVGRMNIEIEGIITAQNGWYSNVVALEDLPSIFNDSDVVKVKFILAKMNSALKVK